MALLTRKLSLADAAKQIGVRTEQLRRECARGKLAHYRIGGRVYIDPADLEDYLARMRCGSRAETETPPSHDETRQRLGLPRESRFS